MPWDKHVGMGHSTEYCFVADDHSDTIDARPFMYHGGDSGCFVFTNAGKWAGVEHGGSVKANVTGKALGYVTDAEDIIAWINGLGGGNKYEARLASF